MNEASEEVAIGETEPARTEWLRRALLDHYDRSRRSLPWRGETDPYRIWVSEVMLQQTRVETVIPYYRAWLERFPDVDALADADPDDVLVRWEGLGYYRRARNLHAGAAYVRDRLDGRLPGSVEALRAIPGIGAYTAAAVASIAFDVPTGAVDGNVKRVLSRLFDEPRPGAAWLQRRADALVDPGRPGDWNQALMDLGATVCTPRNPSCDACPIAPRCRALAAGTTAERPARGARVSVRSSTLAVAVVVDGQGRALLRRRPAEGLLAGLWAFPDAEVDGVEVDGATVDRAAGAAHASRRASAPGRAALEREARRVAREAGATVTASPGRHLGEVRHRFTHLDARYAPVLFRGEGVSGPDARWLSLRSPEGVALPVAQRRIAAMAWRHFDDKEPKGHADP